VVSSTIYPFFKKLNLNLQLKITFEFTNFEGVLFFAVVVVQIAHLNHLFDLKQVQKENNSRKMNAQLKLHVAAHFFAERIFPNVITKA
jgi:hypothetical protein